MTEFQEKLRKQHEESMHRELEALIQTAGEAEAKVRGRDLSRVSPASLIQMFVRWH